jgi:hypothetical protein
LVGIERERERETEYRNGVVSPNVFGCELSAKVSNPNRVRDGVDVMMIKVEPPQFRGFWKHIEFRENLHYISFTVVLKL